MMKTKDRKTRTSKGKLGIQKIPSDAGIDLHAARQRDVAELLGVTVKTVWTWKNECPRRADGRYDLPSVVKWFTTRAVDSALMNANGLDDSALEKWRNLRVQMAEIELAEKRGELVDKVQMENAWLQVLTMFRNGLLALPNGLATRLEGRTARETAAILDVRLREVLAEFSQCPGTGKGGE